MPQKTPWTPRRYPPARRADHTDVYKSEQHGEVRVHDPYVWLEKGGQDAAGWTAAQAALSREYLDQNPERQLLEDEIRKNFNYARFGAPALEDDGRWYWMYNSGLQGHSVIYRSKDSELPDVSKTGGPGGEVYFDPNLLSSDGSVALTDHSVSDCGKYFAYGISRSGSDFFTIYVRPTSAPFATLGASHDDERLPDEVRFAKFTSIQWTKDSKGFFYQRMPTRESHGSAEEDKAGTEMEMDTNALLCYHRLGTDQSEDIVVHKDDEHPTWLWGAEISEVDGRYLFMSISKDTARKNALWVADLQAQPISSNMKWNKLVDEFEAAYYYIANDGPKVYLMTTKDAPKYKLVSVDLTHPPEQRVFQDVIPEDKSALLSEVRAVATDKLAVRYNRNVKDEIYLYTMQGKQLERVGADFVGSAYLFGRRDQPWVFAQLSGFTTPGLISRYDFRAPEGERWGVYRETAVAGLQADEFSAEQVWYESKDGTKVPMFIVRHKDTPKDGTAPAIQYGYGGFAISVTPFFSASYLTWIKMYGGILAVANIRGGNEFGEEWHYAGANDRKINCSDDFIAATQFLVDQKYAGQGKVAIHGTSNGGLLVGTCVNRAPPGLIGAAIAEVGVMDLLKFADWTIGRAWVSDFGNPHDPHDFDYAYAISPIHNVPTDRPLPPVITLTADHDDRVVPAHSFKYAATLQHLHPDNPDPLIIRIEMKAGHGAGKSTEKRIVDAADKLGFVAQSLGLPLKAKNN